MAKSKKKIPMVIGEGLGNAFVKPKKKRTPKKAGY